jgi:hypothetical protein
MIAAPRDPHPPSAPAAGAAAVGQLLAPLRAAAGLYARAVSPDGSQSGDSLDAPTAFGVWD